MFIAIAWLSACVCLGWAYSDPCYDHQKETYSAQFNPTYCRSTCTVTPFFSPDHSVDAYLSLIEDARENIDLLEPG